MTYSGAWRRYQRMTPPAGRNPNLGDGARMDHLTPVDPGTGWEEPTPALPDTPAYLYAADDFMLPQMTIRYPTIEEPESHEYGGVDRGDTLIESQQLAGYAHSQDYGAAAVHHFEAPIMRESDAVYQTQRLEAEFQTSGSRAALTRGRNSLPENNPDGPPPQGHYVMRWIDRQFTRHTIRPDQQPLRPYRAQDAVNIPAPAESAANQYTSPYPNLGNARRLKLMTPQVRRVPRPPDEQAMIDGTEDVQYSDPAYWSGW